MMDGTFIFFLVTLQRKKKYKFGKSKNNFCRILISLSVQNYPNIIKSIQNIINLSHQITTL